MTNLHSNLNEIKGLNTYCGPAVLAALTGRSTDSCAAVISAVSGKNIIKAVQYTHLIEAIKRLNFDAKEIPTPARTLYGCISALIGIDGTFIIVVPDHYVAIEIKEKIAFFIDNHTKAPMPAIASARLTQTVLKIWKVTAKNPDIVKLEEEHARSAWLTKQINQIGYQIDNLVARRSEYERELAKLRGDSAEQDAVYQESGVQRADKS